MNSQTELTQEEGKGIEMTEKTIREAHNSALSKMIEKLSREKAELEAQLAEYLDRLNLAAAKTLHIEVQLAEAQREIERSHEIIIEQNEEIVRAEADAVPDTCICGHAWPEHEMRCSEGPDGVWYPCGKCNCKFFSKAPEAPAPMTQTEGEGEGE